MLSNSAPQPHSKPVNASIRRRVVAIPIASVALGFSVLAVGASRAGPP
jgi:hypothetical protein